jgi:hypothetical protein
MNKSKAKILLKSKKKYPLKEKDNLKVKMVEFYFKDLKFF